MINQNKVVFQWATSRRTQRCQHRAGAMMWSCLWTPQTTIWSAPYARGSSGVQWEPHATTSSARNASYSGSRGTERCIDQYHWTRTLYNCAALDFFLDAWSIQKKRTNCCLPFVDRRPVPAAESLLTRAWSLSCSSWANLLDAWRSRWETENRSVGFCLHLCINYSHQGSKLCHRDNSSFINWVATSGRKKEDQTKTITWPKRLPCTI